jgi:hypothetical protein
MYLTELPSLNAIKIGNLFFKPRNGIEELIAKAVRLVTLEAQGMPEYLGKSGSCTLICKGERSYVVCTRHQLGIKSGSIPDRSILETTRFVGFQNSDFLSNVPTNSCLFVTDNEEEDLHDILLFRAAKESPSYEKEKFNFFPVANSINSKRHASWMVGYPTDQNTITYEPQQLSVVCQILSCNFDTSFNSNASHLKRYSYDRKYSVVDGFSGGAIFSLVGDTQEFEIVLDGIILRAGNGSVHSIDASFLVLAIEKEAKQ